MRTSESITAIAPALVKAQAACLSVVKDKTGKIETKSGAKYEYNYADFASVVQEIKPALRDNGLAMIQWSERHDDGITVVTRVQHDSGEWQETDVFIPVAVVSAQAVGSALTYGKRYGAQAFMLLPSADDDGKAATDQPPEKRDYSKHTARQTAVDEFESMSPEEKRFIQGEATMILAAFENGTNVRDIVESKHYDTAEKLALWSLLPSKVRSAIKNGSTPSPAELGSQA